MNLLSVSLALFLGVVLAATTDAAPSDLKKNGESPSLHRSLHQVQIADAESKCNVFETFDKLVRENNLRAVAISNEWKLRCENFSLLDDFLCPTADAVAAICLAKKPYENPAVLKNYCIPTFSILGPSRRDECNKFCVNYVSAAKGDCCDIDCASVTEPPTQPTIKGYVFSSPILTVLQAAFVRTGLAGPLNSDKFSLTLFAPSDEAFSMIPAEIFKALLTNDEFILHLVDLLLYHVLPEEAFAIDLSDNLVVRAANGEVRDELLITLPPIAVNGNKVMAADIDVSNGVIHIIDGVLLPSWVSNSFTDRIVTDSDLSTLLALVTIAGLGALFAAPGELTLVAPTNSAFVKLPELDFAFLTSLDGEENLTELLLFHILRGVFLSFGFSYEVSGSRVRETFGGGTVEVSFDGAGGIFFNDAQVVQADILTNNGVVHKIDTVLVPNEGS